VADGTAHDDEDVGKSQMTGIREKMKVVLKSNLEKVCYG